MKARWLLISLIVFFGLAITALLVSGVMTPEIVSAEGRNGFDTFYVASGGDCGGETPCYDNIQQAVDAVDDPTDVVKVAEGTYTGVSAREGVTQVVYISKTVLVQGGYAVDDWTTYDPVANPTTIDAQGYGRAFYVHGEISPTVSGLRITGGDATGLGGGMYGWDSGGGIYINQKSANVVATIRDNWIFSNTAGSNLTLGGGIGWRDGNAFLSKNHIFWNISYFGGGVWILESNYLLDGNTVISNTAVQGGGVNLFYCNGTLTKNTITNNDAELIGGGLMADQGSLMLDSNIISGNSAGLDADISSWNAGGGIHMRLDEATLINNVISDNMVGNLGSGLSIRGGRNYLAHNTLARNGGGEDTGIYATESDKGYASLVLTNTILVDHGVGISVTGGNTVTVNSVLWYNTPITVSQSVTAVVSVLNQYTGSPAFSSDGYHITGSSSAIEVGIDSGITTDIDGQSRPQGDAPDLGADEYVFQEPTAVFSGNPTSGFAPLSVDFTNLSTGDFDTCSWIFGDSGSSDVCDSPTHVYTVPGEYTVTLAVSGLGGSDTMERLGYISVESYQVFLPYLEN